MSQDRVVRFLAMVLFVCSTVPQLSASRCAYLLSTHKVQLVKGLHLISAVDLELGDVIQLHDNDLDYFTYTDPSPQWLIVTEAHALNPDGTFSFVLEMISRKTIRGEEERPLRTPDATPFEFRLDWNEKVIPYFHYRGSAELYERDGKFYYSHFNRSPRE